MKKIILLLAVALFLFSCSKKNNLMVNEGMTTTNLMAASTDQRTLRGLSDVFRGSYDAYYASAQDQKKILGVFDPNQDAIGVFFKRIQIWGNSSAFHMYIVAYNHRENMEWIYRAGPTNNPSAVHGAVFFVTGAAAPATTPNSFGYLFGEAGLNRELAWVQDPRDSTKMVEIGSVDFDVNDENIGVIIKTGEDLSTEFASFDESTRFINSMRIRYNPRYPNSNAFVTTLLDVAGLPTAQEAIDSFPSGTQNKEYFTNLFTPGAARIDTNHPNVVADNRMGRSLTEVGGNINDIQLILNNDNAVVGSMPLDNQFPDEEEVLLFGRFDAFSNNAGLTKIAENPFPSFWFNNTTFMGDNYVIVYLPYVSN